MMARILVTGASGQLGAYLLRELSPAARSGHSVVAWSGTVVGERFGVPLRPVDLGNEADVTGAFADVCPDVVLHAGAVARVADCHRDHAAAHRVNVEGTAVLARLAAPTGARLVYVSTDLVFDGERAPYRESDPVCPLSVYARTKADAEAVVLATPRAVVARVSLLFGPSLCGRPTFFDEQVTALCAGRPITLFRDEWRTPLHLATAANALLELAWSDCTGLLHVGGPERLSRLEMGMRLAASLGADASRIIAVGRNDVPAAEPRPCDTALDSSRWRSLFPASAWPTYEQALRSFRP
jgi:dTDP-4-dehydrorhamnose reductase